jgi:hypothetical protein
MDPSRGGRGRDIKATSLLFKTVPSMEQIQSIEKGEWHHIEGSQPQVEQDLRMDIDGEENEAEETQEDQQPTVWGMPRWGCENERGGEVRKGVRLVGMEEVRVYLIFFTKLTGIVARFDIPTSTHRHAQSRPFPLATRHM